MDRERGSDGSDGWLATQLLEELGHGDTPSSSLEVTLALARMLARAKAEPLTQGAKSDLLGEARSVARGYPRDFERFAYNLDMVNPQLAPASKNRIEAARSASLPRRSWGA